MFDRPTVVTLHYTNTGRAQQIARKRNPTDNSINEQNITLKLRGAVVRLRYFVGAFCPTQANREMVMLKCQMI